MKKRIIVILMIIIFLLLMLAIDTNFLNIDEIFNCWIENLKNVNLTTLFKLVTKLGNFLWCLTIGIIISMFFKNKNCLIIPISVIFKKNIGIRTIKRIIKEFYDKASIYLINNTVWNSMMEVFLNKITMLEKLLIKMDF